MIKAVFAAVVLAGSAIGAMSQASAMPMAGNPGASAAQVDFVRLGCGPGWRPNRFGRCVPGARPHYVRPRYVRPYRPMHPPHRW
ncbi:MAG: hypothetical protein U1E30_17995 [Rhodoblastus sp.]